MSVIVDKTLASVDMELLTTEINENATIVKICEGMTKDDPDSLHIHFDAALSGPEDTELDVVLAAHTVPSQLVRRGGLPTDYLKGFLPVYNSVTVVDVQAGKCRDDIDCLDLVLPASTFDITVSGPGGLQTGESEAADKWIGLYIIGDTNLINTPKILGIPDGVTFDQSGYDIKRRIAWIRNDSTSDIMKFYYIGTRTSRKCYFDTSRASVRVLNNGTATTFTAVTMTYMPPTSRQVTLLVYFEIGGSGSSTNILEMRTQGSTIINPLYQIKSPIASNNPTHAQMEMLVSSSRQIEYQVSNASNNSLTLHIVNFIDEI